MVPSWLVRSGAGLFRRIRTVLGPSAGVSVAAYLAAAAISIVAAVLLLGLGRADLRVPFDYGGGALLFPRVGQTGVAHRWKLCKPPAWPAPGAWGFTQPPRPP